jgi:hypothetical protein
MVSTRSPTPIEPRHLRRDAVRHAVRCRGNATQPMPTLLPRIIEPARRREPRAPSALLRLSLVTAEELLWLRAAARRRFETLSLLAPDRVRADSEGAGRVPCAHRWVDAPPLEPLTSADRSVVWTAETGLRPISRKWQNGNERPGLR